MDLRFLNAEPTDAERDAVDALDPAGEGLGRDRLLPALHAVNDRVGWISQGALNHICRRSPSHRPRHTAWRASTRSSRSRNGRRGSFMSARTWPARSTARRKCATR